MSLQERASGMYRLSAFYFARSASDLPFEATPSLFVFIIYFMVRPLMYDSHVWFE